MTDRGRHRSTTTISIAWTQQQAELLRHGPAAANRLDYDLIAEEIEDLGKQRAARLPIALRAHYRAPAQNRVFGTDRTGRSLAPRDRRMARAVRTESRRAASSPKLDLPDRYRVALRLLRYLERRHAGADNAAPGGMPLFARTDPRQATRTGFPTRGSHTPASRSSAAVAVSMRLSSSGINSAARQARRDRVEKFQRDPPAALQEAAAAPEQPGIDRRRHQRHASV